MYSSTLSQAGAAELRARLDQLSMVRGRPGKHPENIVELPASRGRLVGQVLRAEEGERRRLAEALHDEALQELLFARHAIADPTESGLENVRDAIQRAIEQLRGKISDLYPCVLKYAGLSAAIEQVARRQAEWGGFEVTIEIDADACGHEDDLLFAIAREQLTNVAKHSDANAVRLSVQWRGASIVMEVRDDGCGITESRRRAAREEGRIGLVSSKERVSAVGGRLEIESEPGRGTLIRTTVPVTSSKRIPVGRARLEALPSEGSRAA